MNASWLPWGLVERPRQRVSVLFRSRGFRGIVDGLPFDARRRLPRQVILVEGLALALCAIRMIAPMPVAAGIDVIVSLRVGCGAENKRGRSRSSERLIRRLHIFKARRS